MPALLFCLALLAGGADVARTLTTYQTEALAAPDRAVFSRVRIEDPDGVMVDMTDLEGYDFVDSVMIRADADHPISVAEVRLIREIDGLSIAPLIEGSTLNRDSGGSYAPLVNPARAIEIDVAVMKPGDTPDSGDYELLWEGYIDDPEMGGRQSIITLPARDPISRLNDTWIESEATYGGGSPLAAIEDVMQAILDANMGSGEFPLWVVGNPDFGIEEYPLVNVSVLDALKALADLQGWNLHWMWHESPGAFQLTYYEPDRGRPDASGYTPDWTFGPDDYYDLPGLKLAMTGIRNAGLVKYRDSTGAVQTVSDERSSSIALYNRRFIPIDATRSRSIQTSAQASALLANVLDDTEDPVGTQRMDAPLHWPVELGDMHDYESNDVHYDVTESWAVFGYTHILAKNRMRTYVTASGKPSGGYRRWHHLERVGKARLASPPPRLLVTFDANGQTVVSAAGQPNVEKIFITVGDGSAPSFPGPDNYDGVISGKDGTVNTGVKVTTGQDAHVRAIAVDEDGNYSDEATGQFARRIGPFYKNTVGATVTGTTSETALDTIALPAGVLGLDGGLRLTAALLVTGTNGAKTLRVKLGSTTLETITIAAGFSAAARLDLLLFNDGAVDAQVVSTLLHRHGGSPDVRLTTAAEDTSGALNLVITIQLASGSDSVSLQAAYGELVGTD